DTAVATAETFVGSAGDCGTVPRLPNHSRNISRIVARRVRHAGAGSTSARNSTPRTACGYGQHANTFAIRVVTDVRLHRQLHLRRRRAARRTPRARPLDRSIAASRTAGRDGVP